MFHRTRYYGSFPEIEEKFGVRIETHTEFDNETQEILTDSVYYKVYEKETDNFLFLINGDFCDMQGAIINKLKEYGYGNKTN